MQLSLSCINVAAMNVSVESRSQTSAASTLPLTRLRVGGAATVSAIKVPAEHRSRILEMGLLVGTKVQLIRFAPLGDPIEIKLRGYHLTLRRSEADQIHVTTAAAA